MGGERRGRSGDERGGGGVGMGGERRGRSGDGRGGGGGDGRGGGEEGMGGEGRGRGGREEQTKMLCAVRCTSHSMI